jgi:hypothetical protein
MSYQRQFPILLQSKLLAYPDVNDRGFAESAIKNPNIRPSGQSTSMVPGTLTNMVPGPLIWLKTARKPQNSVPGTKFLAMVMIANSKWARLRISIADIEW